MLCMSRLMKRNCKSAIEKKTKTCDRNEKGGTSNLRVSFGCFVLVLSSVGLSLIPSIFRHDEGSFLQFYRVHFSFS